MLKWIKNKAKLVTTAVVTAAVSLVAAVPAFATTPDLGEVVSTAIQTTVTNTIAMFAELLPIALTVFAFTWGVRKAMRFFKTAAN